jgi:hypothetical protein
LSHGWSNFTFVTQCSGAGGDPAGLVSRRRVLGAALRLGTSSAVAATGLGALSGCTPSDPRVSSDDPKLTPTPTPTRATVSPGPPPQTFAAELALADLAAAILAGPQRGKLSAGQRALLTAAAQGHRQHAAALASPAPTARPSSPVPSSRPAAPSDIARLSLPQSLALLRRQELAQRDRARGTALSRSGFESLVWGSISVAAASWATALSSKAAVPVAAAGPSRPMAAQSDVEALQSMIRQLHALVYGYQLALGRLSPTSAAGRRAYQSLLARRSLRNDLVDTLIARSASVPAAAGAYVPPVDPRSPASAAELIRRMETAFQPFCGLWLAAASRPGDRSRAYDVLAGTTATALSWRAPVTVWPGWVS